MKYCLALILALHCAFSSWAGEAVLLAEDPVVEQRMIAISGSMLMVLTDWPHFVRHQRDQSSTELKTLIHLLLTRINGSSHHLMLVRSCIAIQNWLARFIRRKLPTWMRCTKVVLGIHPIMQSTSLAEHVAYHFGSHSQLTVRMHMQLQWKKL